MTVVSLRFDPQSYSYSREFSTLRNRVKRAIDALRAGEIVMVGDDGRRENEADLVFHAGSATAELVNFTLLYGRGLLCVSTSHAIADRLGLATSAKLPGDMAHTAFTNSIDARDGITSGISAQDRATTIKLMADPNAGPQHFISPGHVFPVRAQSGGLLTRAGHTEAVLELCRLADLSPVAAMCEVLGPDGEALRPHSFLNAKGEHDEQQKALRALAYISTVDLLWYKVFYEGYKTNRWEPNTDFSTTGETRAPKSVFQKANETEEHVTLNSALLMFENKFNPKTLRIQLTNGFQSVDNGVARNACCAELILFSFSDATQTLQSSIAEFCDLSGREGIRGSKPAVRRVVTELRALEFLKSHFHLEASLSELAERITFPVVEDGVFLKSVLAL